MNLLIYTHPFAANGDPKFGLNAFRNKLLPIAEYSSRRGDSVAIIAPNHYTNKTAVIKNVDYIEIDTSTFISDTGIGGDLDYHFYLSRPENSSVELAAKIIRQSVSEEPDVIVVWEAAVPHLKLAFPNARIVSLMPCPFSRVPYGDRIVADPVGLFKEGYLYKELPSSLENFRLTEREEIALSRFRAKAKNFFQSKDRIKDDLFRLKEGRPDIQSLTLLPLQISAHYAFRKDSDFFTQLEMLEYVLASSEAGMGVVTTQYITKNIFERAITPEISGYLDTRYPNFLHSSKFDKLHNISQYILPFVDSVTTFSSSLAFQALLLEKPVSVLGNSYIHDLFKINEKNAHAQDRILGFILFRYSILFNQAINQDETFERLLNPDYEKSLLDLPGYEDAFFEGLRFDSAERELTKELSYSTNSSSIPDHIVKAVDAADLISFDIFDTLIERPVLEPKHVFNIIQDRINLDGQLPRFNFAAARIEAEQTAHIQLGSETEEVTINDIYDILCNKYDLSSTDRDAIKALEIQVEKEIMVFRPLGRNIYRHCVGKSKNIVYTSDMYLDRETILEMLYKCGYSRDHNLYLSSEVGKKKKSGTIFPHMARSEDVPFENILHIGDNPLGDVASPANYGIKSVYTKRSITSLRENKIYKKLFGHPVFADLNASATGYLIARHLFDDPFADVSNTSLFRSEAYKVGYCALGPCVTDYALWLDRQMAMNGNDHAFFVARDGRIIKEVFDIIKRSDVSSSYIWGSRRLLRGATVNGIPEFFDILDDVNAAPIDQILFDRFGHRIECEELPANATRMEKIQSAKAAIPRLMAKVQERNLLMKRYCKEIGLADADHPCVVEIGYAATIQEGYQRLTGKSLTGYYLVLLDSALGRVDPQRPMHGYAGNFTQRFNFWHPLTDFSQIYETLFCSDEDTIVDVKADRFDKLIAVRDASMDDFVRKSLIREIHAGARDFARDASRMWGPFLSSIRPNPEVGSRVIKEFVERPTASDAVIFQGVTFENGFAKRSKILHMVPPKSRYKDYAEGKFRTAWRQGSDAITNVKPATNTVKRSPAIIPPPTRQQLLLKKMVRPLVARMGSKFGLEKFDRDPSQYFSDLNTPLYRTAGQLIFPSKNIK